MMTPDELNAILERITQHQQTEQDLEMLRRSLAGDRQVATQLGKYNVNIGEGKEIHIGDRIYNQWDKEAMEALVKSIQEASSIHQTTQSGDAAARDINKGNSYENCTFIQLLAKDSNFGNRSQESLKYLDFSDIPQESIQQAYQDALPPDASVWNSEANNIKNILQELEQFRRSSDFFNRLIQNETIPLEIRNKLSNFAEDRQQLEELLEKEAETSKQKSTTTNPPLKRVLIIAICPKNTTSLNLAQEVREICNALKRASNFNFIVEVRWAARIKDLREAMLEFEPHIVHFSGHGAGVDGLAFEDERGQLVLIRLEMIIYLFKLFSEQVKQLIECVVLNACYSEVQAEAMMSYVGCVIGMQQAIRDKAAIEFSKGFYSALANGRTLDFAFNWGCNGIQAEGIPEDLVPTLKKSTLFSNTLRTENVTDSRHSHDTTNARERLLILTANPQNTTRIRLDEEVREIYAELKRARQQGQIVFEQRWAAQFKDLQEGLFEFRPTIVHFSGHGAGDQGVIFESENGDSHLVKNQPLSSLFNIFSQQVRCVFINTVYSQIQAQKIANHIDYTIGFSNTVQDKACITFSRGFYRALGRDLSIEEAYKLGIIELQSQDIPEDQFPTLNKKMKGSAF